MKRRWLLLILVAAGAWSSAALLGGPRGQKDAGKKGERPAAPAAMKFIAADDAPKAIGPYSQAVVEGGFLFAAGQISLDPKTGELVGGTIEQSADRVFDNLEAVLKAAGLTFADIVKATVYLTKSEDF